MSTEEEHAPVARGEQGGARAWHWVWAWRLQSYPVAQSAIGRRREREHVQIVEVFRGSELPPWRDLLPSPLALKPKAAKDGHANARAVGTARRVSGRTAGDVRE